MAITTYASGSQAATVTTEHFLSSPNVPGRFRLTIDKNAMVAGDVLELRVYKMTITAGTSRPFWLDAVYGVPATNDQLMFSPWIENVLTDTNALRFSITQSFGTSRTFPYTVEKDDALIPTTAGRTLDVSAGGEAGVDWANVGSPTTTVGLSGTTVKTATDVATDTADIKTRLPAALVSGRIDASVGAMAAAVVTAAAVATGAIDADALATDAVTEIANGLLDQAAGIETSMTVRQALRLILSMAVGKLSGAATATNTFRDTTDAKNRIVATVDSDGNRTAVTLDAT